MNLSKLTKEQKLDLIDAIKAKKERAKDRKGNYTPNEGQLPVHACEKKFRYIFSGNAAGKTCLAVHEAMWACLGYNPVLDKFTKVPARVVVVLDLPAKVDQVWLREIRKWFNIKDKQLRKDGKPYINRIIFNNGSELMFGFHEQSALAWESVELSYAIYDEPPPRYLFIALARGGRTKGEDFKSLLIGTPLGCSYLRSDILEPWMRGELEEVECFRTSIEVNRHNLQEGYIESFSKLLTEDEKRIRLGGEFFDLSSLALAHLFKRKTHIIDNPRLSKIFNPARHPCVVAIDPHGSKPHHAIILGADNDNNLYYLKEFKDKSVPREFARKLKEFYAGYRVVDIICDSSGNADMTGGEGYKSFIQVLREEGIRVRGTTFQEKNDEVFMEKIRTVLAIPRLPNNFGLRIPKLRIAEGNDFIVREIENVGWQKSRDGELKDKLDISHQDFLACLKYGLASGISGKKGTEKRQSYTKKGSRYGFGKNK